MSKLTAEANADISSDKLTAPSFLGLLLTQTLTATNDNIFRWLAIGIGKDYVEPQHHSMILMAGTVCFVLPYLLVAAPAGYLADRFSKRTVIVGCKVAEIFIMALGIVAIATEQFWLLLTVVALMGAQSALFSPSKLGIIPELLKPTRISAANSMFGLATVGSTIVGAVVGSWLSEATGDRGKEWAMSAYVLIGVAVVGWLFSLMIRSMPAANPKRPFPWNAVSQTIYDLRLLASNRALFRVALGIVFFWSIGTLANLNIDQFAFEGGALKETTKSPLLVSLVVGVGIGSILAGLWSAGRVELGLLPLGAFGVALSSMLLFTAQGAIVDAHEVQTFTFAWACFLLLALGTSAGLFSIPLESYMQHNSDPKSRGSILAATNFLVFTGVLIASLFYYAARLPFHEGSRDNVANINHVHSRDIRELESKFTRSIRSGEKPRIENYLKDVEANERESVLAHLLWIETKETLNSDGFVDSKDYEERFKNSLATVSSVITQASSLPLLTAAHIFFISGLLTIPVFIYIIWLLPQATIRFIVWLATNTIYRVKLYGIENIPAHGGALLVPNHVSWLDGILLLLVSSRPVRMVVFSGNFKNKWFIWMADLFGAIMIGPRPKLIAKALKTARQALQNGELVCIFPEGGITRSGQLKTFKPGMMKILKGTDAPVIPVYLDELWGSIFSFEGGKFFWKWPRKLPYPVSIHFGEAIPTPKDQHVVRNAVQQLGADAVEQRADRMPIITRQFIRQCKKRKRGVKATDSTGAQLKGGELLTRALVLRRLINRHAIGDDEQFVGVLLPPSLGGVVTNAALALDRRVAVNLNYTVSSEVMNACIEHAGIKTVLTSRKFMEKMDFDLNAKVILLEDFKDKPTLMDKVSCAFQAYVLPAAMLESQLQLHKVKHDDILTLIFTSGSTGTPKGVMLTYSNVMSNVDAINQIIRLTYDDTVVGILPFFHSMGYTVTLWTMLALDVRAAYHFSPLDGKQVGKLCRKNNGTVLLATPTFLRTYTRRCDAEDFKKLDVVVTGAEKLPADVADAFEKKFGIRPVEGYGTTELSPLASVNIPLSRSDKDQVDCKEGTVGRPVPGVSARIVDPDTFEDLAVGESGMLLIKGPNVMKGYYKREDLTAEAIKDGWYVTGDIALIDADGFIQITGRQSRFSKIGGEMIPHIQIEEILNQIIGGEVDNEELKAAVTAVPNVKKGEQLIVLHLAINETPEELIKGLQEAGLPNIFIPSKDSFIQVDKLPILGSGKLDLKMIKQVALEKMGMTEPDADAEEKSE
ncbi:MAG: acyl-[acyl-carrier-protein]-phospholipid O-acyltransferase [Pirellulaceae bacterium]|jgi:acyl-[acyl-carrier-protein]-phospholipid O-acyltransferase/long-chain-fatty-acid--[acyl-carrier-protein] ligase